MVLKKDFDREWLYGVIMYQSNPHSLASELGLDDDGVLKILLLFKIAYHHDDTLRIRRELKYCKGDNSERDEFFGN